MRCVLRFGVLLAAQLGLAPAGRAQDCLPFGPGERLTYAVRVAMLGAKGRAVMSVDSAAPVRGREVLALRSEASVGIGFLSGSDRTTSWVDPQTLATLRFVQRERHLISRATDSVEVFPELRQWTRQDGTSGTTLSDAPLDVLSFIYFLRTLPLSANASWTFERHFDEARNPTNVQVVGRDTVVTEAGRFDAWIVEVQVRDTTHYGGHGVIRYHFSTDERHVPVRIQSVMPQVGTTTMTLSGVTPPARTICPEPPTRWQQ